jgi:hypothetical protein
MEVSGQLHALDALSSEDIIMRFRSACLPHPSILSYSDSKWKDRRFWTEWYKASPKFRLRIISLWRSFNMVQSLLAKFPVTWNMSLQSRFELWDPLSPRTLPEVEVHPSSAACTSLLVYHLYFNYNNKNSFFLLCLCTEHAYAYIYKHRGLN